MFSSNKPKLNTNYVIGSTGFLTMLTDLGLGARRKQDLGQLLTLDQSRRQRDIANRAFALVLYPSRPSDVTAYNGLNGQYTHLLYQNRPPLQLFAVLLHIGRHFVKVGRDQVVRQHIG